VASADTNRRFAGLFKRQTPVGRHIPDFVSFVQRIAIELVNPGESEGHRRRPRRAAAWLEARDYAVVDMQVADVERDLAGELRGWRRGFKRDELVEGRDPLHVVIAREAKQSIVPQTRSHGLLRRFAPRNDGVGVSLQGPCSVSSPANVGDPVFHRRFEFNRIGLGVLGRPVKPYDMHTSPSGPLRGVPFSESMMAPRHLGAEDGR